MPANASLALAWGPMIPVAWFASAIISKVGPRVALCYGACGYVLYGSALYVNTTTGNQWYLMLGAFFSAMTSGVFFPTEGAIILMYPEPWRKGRCLALWQSVYRVSREQNIIETLRSTDTHAELQHHWRWYQPRLQCQQLPSWRSCAKHLSRLCRSDGHCAICGLDAVQP